jgi:hypothetical protein
LSDRWEFLSAASHLNAHVFPTLCVSCFCVFVHFLPSPAWRSSTQCTVYNTQGRAQSPIRPIHTLSNNSDIKKQVPYNILLCCSILNNENFQVLHSRLRIGRIVTQPRVAAPLLRMTSAQVLRNVFAQAAATAWARCERQTALTRFW